MTGHVELLRGNLQRVETVRFSMFHELNRVALMGQVEVYRNMCDESGILCARLVHNNKLFLYQTLPRWSDFPSALDELRVRLEHHYDSATRGYRKRYVMGVYEFQAQSSLSPVNI